MKIGFVGAGKIGCSFGKYLKDNGFEISGYFSKNRKSAESAAAFTESTCFGCLYPLAENSDIIFITVCDDSIIRIWEKLSLLNIKGKFICHCSGALSSGLFEGAAKKEAYVCSVHPMLAVSDKYGGYKKFAKAFFTLEGNHTACEKIKNILENIGNKVKIINSEKKTLYHVSCVFQSNLINALIYSGVNFFKECGFNEEEIYSAAGTLVIENIENIFEKGVVKALTGPVERNDINTVVKHMETLKGTDKTLYKILSGRLSEIAALKNPSVSYEELKKILEVS